MGIGSLVIWRPKKNRKIRTDIPIKWIPKPIEDILTIRRVFIDENGKIIVSFEEGIIGLVDNCEYGIPIDELEEIQSIQDSNSTIQEFNEIINHGTN